MHGPHAKCARLDKGSFRLRASAPHSVRTALESGFVRYPSAFNLPGGIIITQFSVPKRYKLFPVVIGALSIVQLTVTNDGQIVTIASDEENCH